VKVVTVKKGLAAQDIFSPGYLVIKLKGQSYHGKDSDHGKLLFEPIEVKDPDKQQLSSLTLSLEDLNQIDLIQYRYFKIDEIRLEEGVVTTRHPIHLKINLNKDTLQAVLKRVKRNGELRVHIDVQLGDLKSSQAEATIQVVDEHADSIQEQKATCVSRYPRLVSFVPLVDRIIELVRKDDAEQLQDFITNLAKAPDVELYNRALLVAAEGGCIQCLTYLLSAGLPNILSPGAQTSKIALHFAFERADIQCIKALLLATDINDFYAPADQLLFGDKPNRPIDAITLIDDMAVQREILQLIESILESPKGNNTSKIQRQEIESFINETRAYFLLLLF
jgi:hypothetical protein